MKNMGDGIKKANNYWDFKSGTAENFDQHIEKSIPLYHQGQQIICDISDFFIGEQSICYELGCATGSLIHKLAQRHQHKRESRFIGVDLEPEMIDHARARYDKAVDNLSYQIDDITAMDFSGSDLLISYYTIQFIRPSQRQLLIDQIYQGLNWGGGFLLFEKVRANDARFQDMMTTLYQQYKLDQGYKAEEILFKSLSLKGVLEPFSTQGNLDLLRRAGFVDIISVFKYLCFEGFLAIK